MTVRRFVDKRSTGIDFQSDEREPLVIEQVLPCVIVNFEKALLAYEDRHFYAHPGVDPLAFGRAVWQNIRAKKVVSGGSTISMQLVKNPKKFDV
ncbi:MAG: hypothetical protein EOO38_20060, partial [Cytophagaceae bacterium]